MCGFAGFIKKHDRTDDRTAAILRGFDSAIHHRGPNDGGMYVGERFAVAHRRLSIIDVTHGQQPMLTQDGLVGVAYNGEIYNHRELRDELIADGVTFATNCDTEVLLAMFFRYGEDCFSRLEGMFSAFIWDRRHDPDGEYFLVRDQLGVKPLYLYEDATQFVFSSELMPLVRADGLNLDLEPDPLGLASYLTYRYVTAPHTFFKRIRRIEAGSYVKIRGANSANYRYWDLPVEADHSDLELGEASEELKRLLRHSVAQQQMAEVPVGLLLSGGLDSSVIGALCAEIGVSPTSFSIGFPELNEFEFARDVAQKFHLPFVPVVTTPSEICQRFDKVVSAMDEPIADPACFPLHILCEDIKQSVTVVLSGEGSDELLGGYPQYQRVLDADMRTGRTKFEHFMDFSWYFAAHDMPLKCAVPASRRHMQKIYFDERSTLEGMLAFDMKTWLPENLMAKADKILMSHSLEGRFPFLSCRIVEFVASLPSEFKIGADGGKAVLRHAFANDLPQSVLTRPKMGFSVPVAAIVAGMRERIYELLEDSRTGLFGEQLDHARLIKILDDHYRGINEQPLYLWTLLVFLQWQTTLPSKAATARGSARMQSALSH